MNTIRGLHPDVGLRIRLLREKAGLSQNALARNARVSQSTLSYLETGSKSPSIDTLLRICDALGITVADLLLTDNEQLVVPKRLRFLIEEAQRLNEEQVDLLSRFLASLIKKQ